MDGLVSAVLIGVGATATMDVWGIVRKRVFGIPAANYGLVGRWLAHMPRGRFRHESIAKAAPVSGERLLGWAAHYLIGIAFAAILLGVWGTDWIYSPTIAPALIVGIATVAAPFLIMQPGMGQGIAASRTPRPWNARLQSLVTHTVFGFGLYATARVASAACTSAAALLNS